MEKNKDYESVTLEIIHLATNDVITTSSDSWLGDNDGPGFDKDGWA